MKIDREIRKEVSFQLGFKGFQARNHPKLSRKSVPTSWGIVRKCPTSKSRSGSKRVARKKHVQRTRQHKLDSKWKRSRGVEAAENKDQNFEVDSLFDGEPVKLFE